MQPASIPPTRGESSISALADREAEVAFTASERRFVDGLQEKRSAPATRSPVNSRAWMPELEVTHLAQQPLDIGLA